MDKNDLLRQRDHLARELAEAEAALPAHSIRPHQLQRVEDLEERLEEVEKMLAELDKKA
ncbi:MAG: hypothetical protein PVG03_09690 [Desulfarculaceae bacterium]|jgi:hypothetical protein